MHFLLFPLTFILLFWSCTPTIPIAEATHNKDIESDITQQDISLISNESENNIWEFLMKNPSEDEVLNRFGNPDSVWIDENDELMVYYYFIQEYQDYNFIEIEIK